MKKVKESKAEPAKVECKKWSFGFNNMIVNAIALLTLMGMALGIFFFAEERYASAANTNAKIQQMASTVDKVAMRVDYSMLEDQLFRVGDRITRIKDKYPNPKKMPEVTKEELRTLEAQQKKLQNKIDKIENKIDSITVTK